MEKNFLAERDKYRKKNFWIGRTQYFDLAQELKYFIALDILSFNNIEF